MYDVIIIGAGAAGMMAAGTAAQNGKKVLVIEKMEKAGRKIRITGKGRCNLTNARPPEEFAEQVRTNADFFATAFAEFNNRATIRFFVYTIAGAFAGLTGAMYTALYASAMSDMGAGMEMDAIASCVLGGVSLNGGQGSVAGVLLGSLTMAVICKALPLIGISQFWKDAIKGAIILVAIIVNVIVRRAMDRNTLKVREI